MIDRFGGVTALSKELGRPTTTVQSWKRRGVIPARQQPRVLAAARRKGIKLGPEDLIAWDIEDERRSA